MQTIANGHEVKMADIKTSLAEKFKLTSLELNELLPSGKQPVFNNRIGWSKTHLKKAGLVDSPKKGFIKITPLGISVLQKSPTLINVSFLKQYPAYLEFITGTNNSTPASELKSTNVINNQVTSATESTKTPDEILEGAHQQLRNSLVQDIISTLKGVSPYFFEKIVVDLLVKMGYGGSFKDAGSTTKKSGDDGIDGIIKEDKLGLDVIYIQAKRWNSPVGRPEIHSFVGALAGQGAKKGVFITTDRFTADAKNFVPKNETKIVLIDGEQLAQYMIDYNLGVSTINTYEIKRLDTDFFEED